MSDTVEKSETPSSQRSSLDILKDRVALFIPAEINHKLTKQFHEFAADHRRTFHAFWFLTEDDVINDLEKYYTNDEDVTVIVVGDETVAENCYAHYMSLEDFQTNLETTINEIVQGLPGRRQPTIAN